jgi:hypothetical protein
MIDEQSNTTTESEPSTSTGAYDLRHPGLASFAPTPQSLKGVRSFYEADRYLSAA